MFPRILILLVAAGTAFGQGYTLRNNAFVGVATRPVAAAAGNGLLTNLISYWKLDDAANGNRADSHGTNTLTDYNNNVGSSAAVINNGAVYGASGARTYKNDNADLRTGDIDFAISAWVNLTDTNDAYGLCGKNEGGGDREWYLVYDNSNDRYRFIVYSATDADAVVSASNFGSPSTNVWHHIVAWHDSVNNQLGIVVNAGTANTVSYSNGVKNTDTATFAIGSRGDSGNLLKGKMDEVGFWKMVPTSAQRTLLYNGGAGLPYASFP
jgi:hypothetical protein